MDYYITKNIGKRLISFDPSRKPVPQGWLLVDKDRNEVSYPPKEEKKTITKKNTVTKKATK